MRVELGDQLRKPLAWPTPEMSSSSPFNIAGGGRKAAWLADRLNCGLIVWLLPPLSADKSIKNQMKINRKLPADVTMMQSPCSLHQLHFCQSIQKSRNLHLSSCLFGWSLGNSLSTFRAQLNAFGNCTLSGKHARQIHAQNGKLNKSRSIYVQTGKKLHLYKRPMKQSPCV